METMHAFIDKILQIGIHFEMLLLDFTHHWISLYSYVCHACKILLWSERSSHLIFMDEVVIDL